MDNDGFKRLPNMADIKAQNPTWTEAQRNSEFNRIQREYYDQIAANLRAEKAIKKPVNQPTRATGE